MERNPSSSSLLAEPFIFVAMCLIVGVVVAGTAVTAIFDRITGNRVL
jgi:hypothetical protein